MTPYTRSPIFEQIWGPFYSRALALPGLQVQEKVIHHAFCGRHHMVKARAMGSPIQREKGKAKGGNPTAYNGSLKFRIMANDEVHAFSDWQVYIR